MSGKLKIIRALANPIPKRKKSAKVKRRKGARQRAVRSVGSKWIVRGITQSRAAVWWTGAAWSGARAKARKFSGADAAARELKKARSKAPAGWVVLDVMPA